MYTIAEIVNKYNLDAFEQELLEDLGLGDSIEIRPGVTVYREWSRFKVEVRVRCNWARSGS